MILIFVPHQPRTGIGSELLDSVTLETINGTVFSVLLVCFKIMLTWRCEDLNIDKMFKMPTKLSLMALCHDTLVSTVH
jgi:hypothetical protein